MIDCNSIVELIVESAPKTKREEIESKLQLGKFMRDLSLQLMPLFGLFFCVQYFDLGLKSCSSKPEEYCHAKQLWKTNTEKINAYQQQLVAAAMLKNINPPLLDPLTDRRIKRIVRCTPETVISGKFMLSMIFHYVKSHYSLGSITFDSFVYRVAKNSKIESLDGVAAKIKKYIG